MEKIPSIDMGDIRNTVYDYTDGKLKHVHDGKARVNGVYVTTPEEYLEEYTKYDRQISHEEVVNTLTYLLKAEVLDEDSQKLCHLLINNPRYTRKMKLISDGSYRNNRIWFNHKTNISISCFECYEKHIRINLDDMTVKQKLNWMWNHYDTIYFQIQLYNSIDEVLEDIEYNRLDMEPNDWF